MGPCCLGLLNAGKRSPEWREVSKRHVAGREKLGGRSQGKARAREVGCRLKNELQDPLGLGLLTGIISVLVFVHIIQL